MDTSSSPSAPLYVRLVRFLWILKVPVGVLSSLIVGATVLGPRIHPSGTVASQGLRGAALTAIILAILAVVALVVSELVHVFRADWKNTK